MSTTDLLRRALEADAAAAADPDRIRDARRRLAVATAPDGVALVVAPGTGGRPGRRRRLALSCVVVALAALAVVGLFVAVRPGPTSRPTPTAVAVAPTSLPPRWQFTVEPDPGGLRFLGGDVTSSEQAGTWARAGSSGAVASLQVSAARDGHPVPARSAGATDVQVGGTTGWTRRIPDPATDPGYDATPFAGLVTLLGGGTATVWTDAATGLTVTVQTDASLSADRITQLVSTVHVGATRPVMVPFRAAYVPQSTVLPFRSVFAPLPTDDVDAPAQVSLDDGGLGFFDVEVSPRGTFPSVDDPTFPRTGPTRIGRWDVTYRPGSLHTVLTDGRVDLVLAWGTAGRTRQEPESAVPVDELTRFLAGLTVADPDDPTTWFDVEQTLGS